MQHPLPTAAMALLYAATRCPVLALAAVLPMCYAVPSTDIGYGTTRPGVGSYWPTPAPICVERYDPPKRCPVLIYRKVLYGPTTRWPRCPTSLRACYAMSGTDIADDPTGLRFCYAVSGRSKCAAVLSGTLSAYARATECPYGTGVAGSYRARRALGDTGADIAYAAARKVEEGTESSDRWSNGWSNANVGWSNAGGMRWGGSCTGTVAHGATTLPNAGTEVKCKL
eukprot:3940954-Rhodomonas_salina.1